MAANPEPTRPFRWDVTRRERLGSLAARPCEALWFLDDLEDCAAKVLARSTDARRLYFVGRSPASIRDFLTGALEATSWHERLVRLPFSMRCEDDRQDVIKRPHLRRQLEANLGALGLHPSELQRGKGVVAFVDLVCEGGTFGNLIGLLRSWTIEAGAQWDVVRTKLRCVAITEETRPAPRHWRWHDDVPELQHLRRSALVQIALSQRVWRHFADDQDKLECSFPPPAWTDTNGPSTTIARWLLSPPPCGLWNWGAPAMPDVVSLDDWPGRRPSPSGGCAHSTRSFADVPHDARSGVTPGVGDPSRAQGTIASLPESHASGGFGTYEGIEAAQERSIFHFRQCLEARQTARRERPSPQLPTIASGRPSPSPEAQLPCSGASAQNRVRRSG